MAKQFFDDSMQFLDPPRCEVLWDLVTRLFIHSLRAKTPLNLPLQSLSTSLKNYNFLPFRMHLQLHFTCRNCSRATLIIMRWCGKIMPNKFHKQMPSSARYCKNSILKNTERRSFHICKSFLKFKHLLLLAFDFTMNRSVG